MSSAAFNHIKGRKEMFNNALDTFYLQLYGTGQMIKNHT